MKLIHDKPINKGMENMLKRARRFTDCQWYGLKALPIKTQVITAPSGALRDQDAYLPAYTPQTGLLYSGNLRDEKYIGYTVAPETFATALLNPNSALYANNLHMSGGATYYGMVCSCFVSYVAGMPYRVNCRDWAENPMVEEITDFTAEDLQLGDILNLTEGTDHHIIMISGILRDENGRVHTIETSESTPPASLRRSYAREQFMVSRFEIDHYKVYRLKSFDHITYEPNPYFPAPGESTEGAIDFQLMTNFGHNSSVLLHEEPVELTLLKGDWDEFVVTAPDGTEKSYPAGQKVKVDCLTIGNYSAVCRKGTETSDAVCWHVHQIKLKSDKLVYKVGQPITLTYENKEDNDVFLARINVTPTNSCRAWQDVAGKSGTVTFPGLDKPGNYWAMVTSKNDICHYTSGKVFFEVVE